MVKKLTSWRWQLSVILFLCIASVNSFSAQINPTDDFDGDGIINSIDIDDDNDGVPDTVECSTAYPSTPPSANTTEFFLYANSGNRSAGSLETANIASASNWVPGDGLTATSYYSIFTNYFRVSNVDATDLNTAMVNNEYVEHGFTTTSKTAGIIYYAMTYYRSANFHWAVVISDDNFTTYKILNPDISQVSGTGVNKSHDLDDYRLKPNTTYQLRTYFWGRSSIDFDDLRIFGYDECDVDGDGIPNRFDLDSDGDSCPDAMESGVYEYVHSNGGVMSKGSLTTNTIDPAGVANAIAGSGASADYGANGYYNLLETSGNGTANYISTYDMALDIGVSNCSDVDADEVPDFIDIDDDNDGVLDKVEACPIRQYSVPGDIIDGTTTTVESSVASTGFAESTSTGCAANSVSDNQYPYINPAACSFITRTGTQTSGTWKITFSSPVVANKIMLGFSASAVAGTNITYTYDVNPGTDATISTAKGVEFSNVINLVNLTKNGITTYKQTVSGATNSGISLKGLGDRTVKSLQFSISGLATTGGISFFVYVQSDNCDPDGDGIPNSLDNDSDNDGCSDAQEAGVIDYITANGGTYSSGVLNNPSSSLSSEAIVGNNTPSDYGNNGFYSGIENNDAASAAYQGTYTYSNVINDLIKNCNIVCYKSAATSGTVLDTKHGITSLQRAGSDDVDNWPMVRKGAWTALESKTKGFVLNRLTATEIGNIPAANLVEGMMVYNITEDCLYINIDGTAGGWKCFGKQTCP